MNTLFDPKLLVSHPQNQAIYGHENIDELTESLREHGCLEAIIVTPDYVVVSGHRRLKAALDLGFSEVPIRIQHFDNENAVLEALLLANLYREKTKIQRHNELDVWAVIETEKAKQRMSLGGQGKEVTSLPSYGQTRDIVGAKGGISGRNYEQGKKVREAILESPQPIAEALSTVFEQSTEIALEVVKQAPEKAIEVARGIQGGASAKEAWQAVQGNNPHVANNSGNNEWYTPSDYIEAARYVMNGVIDLDPASSDTANKTVQAVTYFTAETNGLDKLWHGNVWLNPPYAGELIGKFTTKFVTDFDNGDIYQGIVLVNNATETQWFQGLLQSAWVVCFPKQRIRFLDPNGKPTGAPLQGQAVLYFGPNVELFTQTFLSFGAVLHVH